MNVVLDYVAQGFLTFSQIYLILVLILLGARFVDSSVFYHAALVLSVGILINVALKITFQVPLLPHLNKAWFAFPSGHMQMVTVFYGWCAFKISQRPFRALVGLIFLGVGFGLVHAHYHTVVDVLGGYLVGIMVIRLYDLICDAYQRWYWVIILGSSTLLFAYSGFFYHIRYHACVAYIVVLINAFEAGRQRLFFMRA